MDALKTHLPVADRSSHSHLLNSCPPRGPAKGGKLCGITVKTTSVTISMSTESACTNIAKGRLRLSAISTYHSFSLVAVQDSSSVHMTNAIHA